MSEFVTTCDQYFANHNIDPFRVMGLRTDVPLTKKMLTMAYRARSLVDHPDRKGGDASRFRLLNTCYKYLWETVTDLPTQDVLQTARGNVPGNNVHRINQNNQGPAATGARPVTMDEIKSAAPGHFDNLVTIGGYKKVAECKSLQKWEDLQAVDCIDMFVPGRTEYVTITQVGDQTVFRSNLLSEDWDPMSRRGPVASQFASPAPTSTITARELNAYSRPDLQPIQMGRPQDQEWRYGAKLREEREREEEFMRTWGGH